MNAIARMLDRVAERIVAQFEPDNWTLIDLEALAFTELRGQIAGAFEQYRRTVHGFAPNAPGISVDAQDTSMKVHCSDCDATRVLHRGKCPKCGGDSWIPKGREIDARYRKVNRAR